MSRDERIYQDQAETYEKLISRQPSLIDVQLATIEESDDILELWQGSARWLQAKGINQWKPEFFDLKQVHEWFNQGSEIYLARWNEQIVGTLLICWSDPFIWEELDNTESGYIHRFAVSRKHVGFEIGQSLLEWAENYIRSKGKTFIRLDCMEKNDRLNQYYRNNGYQYVRRKQGDKWSANLYEKR